MKKIILLLIVTTACFKSFSQLNYKIGLTTSLYTNDGNSHPKIAFGSFLGEVGYNVTGTNSITATASFIRVVNEGEGFNQFPILIGTKHKFNEYFYAGGNAGASCFSRIKHGVNFTWSTYCGMEIKDISVDIRYLNTIKPNSGLSTTVFVLSYNF